MEQSSPSPSIVASVPVSALSAPSSVSHESSHVIEELLRSSPKALQFLLLSHFLLNLLPCLPLPLPVTVSALPVTVPVSALVSIAPVAVTAPASATITASSAMVTASVPPTVIAPVPTSSSGIVPTT